MIGTWSGTWPVGLNVELTVVSIEKRQAHGIYCNVRGIDHGVWVWDIGPDYNRNKVRAKGTTMNIRIGKVRYKFRVDPEDRDAMRMEHRRDGAGRNHLDMKRIDAATAPCRGRVTPR